MPDEREIETTTLGQIKQYAMQIKADSRQRDLDAEEYERMYLMDWEKKDNVQLAGQRVTVDTTPRVAVEGATRLMIATEPAWSIEGEEVPDAELLETKLKSWWMASGHAARQPHEHDLIRSGLLYGSMDAAINPTADLHAHAKKTGNKATINAAEQMMDRTPYLIDVWNPRQGYPVYDIFGLSAYYRQTEMRAADAEARFGKLPEDLTKRGRYQNLTVNIFYDREYYAAWIGPASTAATAGGASFDLACKPHKLPFIPIMSQLVDGSMLFDKPEFQRQPLLYSLLRSGLWDSMNLYLTVAFTAILAMGTVGKWIHTAPASAPGKRLDIDWKTFVIELEQGEGLAPLLAKGLLDPDAAQLYEKAKQMAEESTIYRQALGAPVSGNMPFSAISLLAQAGRLPLIAAQRKGGWGIAELGHMMLQWTKEESRYRKGTGLQASDIPQKIDVDCKLKVQLPQDELQMANILRLMTQGEDPLVSKQWGLEHILGIGQPEKMQEEIWNERAGNMLWLESVKQLMQEQLAKAQEQQAAAAKGAQQFAAGGMPPAAGTPSGPPQGMPPSMPPQAGPMMGSPDQAQQIEGIPPGMAGQLPGMGQGTVPPGAPPMPGEEGGML